MGLRSRVRVVWLDPAPWFLSEDLNLEILLKWIIIDRSNSKVIRGGILSDTYRFFLNHF